MIRYRTAVLVPDAAERRQFQAWLAADPDLVLVGANELMCVGAQKPTLRGLDLVIIDPAVTGPNGFRCLEELGSDAPCAVVLTDDGETCALAFDARACDCLVRPVPESRFLMSILNAKRRMATDLIARLAVQMAEAARALRPATRQQPDGYTDQLVFKVRRRVVSVPVAEITSVKGASQYAQIRSVKGDYLLSRPLSALERQLDPRRFFRIHRSLIVNSDYIREVMTNGDGRYHVELTTGQRLPLGRSRRELLGILLQRAGSAAPRLAR